MSALVIGNTSRYVYTRIQGARSTYSTSLHRIPSYRYTVYTDIKLILLYRDVSSAYSYIATLKVQYHLLRTILLSSMTSSAPIKEEQFNL